VQDELDAAEKMEVQLLADAGMPPYYIADEMDIPLYMVERYLYAEPE
jgi:hypothetical protein